MGFIGQVILVLIGKSTKTFKSKSSRAHLSAGSNFHSK
jgi:hypothetical protein